MRPGAAARHPQGKELLLAAELRAVGADGPAVGILRLLEGFASSSGCVLTSGSPAAVGGGSRGGAAPSKTPSPLLSLEVSHSAPPAVGADVQTVPCGGPRPHCCCGGGRAVPVEHALCPHGAHSAFPLHHPCAFSVLQQHRPHRPCTGQTTPVCSAFIHRSPPCAPPGWKNSAAKVPNSVLGEGGGRRRIKA